jgi:mono/diheme cytochrome c family protein
MRRFKWLSLTAVLAISTAGALWLATAPVPYFSGNEFAGKQGDIHRGRLIFAAGQCASCHASPGQKDRLRLGGGLALASPFGTFRVPNISPDPGDGIGRWTVTDLGNALVSGISPKGEHYYPAFPYVGYTGMSVTNINDLYAYLMTLPQVAGRQPPHDLALIFKIRRLLGVWKLFFFRERATAAVATGDVLHDRGGYLVETLAHCAECHSSRNIFAAIKEDTRFAGGPDPEGTGFVPNITPARIGKWTEEDITRMLETGDTPDHGRVGSSMADVVVNTSMLSADDRAAIARYVKALPARETPRP